MKIQTFKPEELYLCPGDEHGCHITTSSTHCGCGNTNLASIAKILNRKTVVDQLMDENPILRLELRDINKIVYRENQ